MKTLKLPLIALVCIVSASFAAPVEKVGVLILAHGGSDAWNQQIDEAVAGIRKKYPVEVALGMALPRTIQEGINKLEAQGVNKIIVVPMFISSYSFIIRQTEFLLGKRDVLADPPMVMDHGAPAAPATMDHSQHGTPTSNDAHNMHGGHGSASQPTLQKLSFKSEIIMTSALDDNPVVADILFSRISELSKNPEKETVIIVGHGPNPEDDNKNWVMAMESLADQVRAKQGNAKPWRTVLSVTVRDDADKAIYEMAKEHLRGLVRQAGKQGDVIVVPLLLSQGGVEQGIVKRLEGLTYTWNGKTLLPDAKFATFVETSVSTALAGKR